MRAREGSGALTLCDVATQILYVVLYRSFFEVIRLSCPSFRPCCVCLPCSRRLRLGRRSQRDWKHCSPMCSRTYEGVDGLHVDNRAALQQLAEAAGRDMQLSIAQDRETTAQDVAIDAVARRAVAELKFIGGCPRKIEGCPAGWTLSDGVCTPPGSYDGPCGATALAALSQGQAESFALNCRMGWPCQECRTRFVGCPRGWSAVGGLCVAPPDYDGICNPAMDFAMFDDAGRARWAATCGAPWPCA